LEKCNIHLSEKEFNDMDMIITSDEIGEALRLLNNGKAPGVDGIPYEFYKLLDILFQLSKNPNQEMFNVLGFLTELYKDVESYGVVPGTHF
ncbi:hypothetical protein B0H14DRAFT_2167858, partial [Mycena olivaceomarginata]